MISVALPSRGFIFAEVENAIEKMRKNYDIEVFRSWDKKIPDAQNYLVEQALKANPTHIFFVEEDTVPEDKTLDKLLKLDADIACCDYSVNGWSCVAKDSKTKEILWCGLGCTLVKANIFKKLEKPYFRTDKSYRLNDKAWIDNPMKYGGLDIWFCIKAREAGFQIKQIEGECRHLSFLAVGDKEVNNGLHHIAQRPTISKFQYIE